MIITPSPSGKGRDLIRFLAQAGHWPDTVAPRQQNLEEIFLSLTGAEK
jgi:ABC-2 type transport system ATP-binding protein